MEFLYRYYCYYYSLLLSTTGKEISTIATPTTSQYYNTSRTSNTGLLPVVVVAIQDTLPHQVYIVLRIRQIIHPGGSMHFIHVPPGSIIQEEWICVDSAPGAGQAANGGKGGSDGGKQGGKGVASVEGADGEHSSEGGKGADEHASEGGKGADGEHSSKGGKGPEHGSKGGKGADGEHSSEGGKGAEHGSKGVKGADGEHGSKGGKGAEHGSKGVKGADGEHGTPPDDSLGDASHELVPSMDDIAVVVVDASTAALTRGRSRTPPRSPARSYH